ncbi:MAG TPA: OsmC family protein [Marmoricola sp.]|nr:OsmC family protein [Marmoricola sp.]
MDPAELRALQAPVKTRYREHPDTARTPLHASGAAKVSEVSFDVGQWTGTTRAGLHVATGGTGDDACSGDMLLEAVLACAGVTMRSVATAMGIDMKAMKGEATAFFDARGTLGMDRDIPVGIGDLEVVFSLETDATDEQLTKLADLAERFCVVGQSLAVPPRIVVRRGTA